MSRFRPKETLELAQQAEKKGHAVQAANLYAMMSIYLRKKGKFPEAKKMIDRALDLAPNSGRLLLQKALCEWAVNQDGLAINAIKAFAEKCIERNRIQTYLPQAEEALADLPQLRALLFQTLLKVDGMRPELFIGLAKARIQEKNFADAEKILLDALELNKRQTTVLKHLSEVVEESGRGELGAYVDQFKNGTLKLDDLRLLISSGKEASQQSIRKEVPSPSPTPTQGPAEHVSLKDLIDQIEAELEIDTERSYAEVEPLMKEFRRRAEPVLSQNSKARIDMACAYFEMGRYAEAKEELERITESDPLFAEARCVLGQTLIEEGANLAALDVFQSCLRMGRVDSNIYKEANYQIAVIYVKLGDWKSARKHAQVVEKQDPEYRQLKMLKEEIEGGLRNPPAPEKV